MTDLHPPMHAVRDAVARALAEDLTPLGDISAALVDPGLVARARIVSRAAGVLAGRLCATEAWSQVGGGVVVSWSADDGDDIRPGATLAAVEGPLAPVLSGERTALNFLGHLSGVATLTRRFAEAAAPLRVWDTRKTTPGLRVLEKAAVRAGGGANHRGNLSDWVMLKDNHLAGIGITVAVGRALAAWPGRTVHVECDTADQALEAVDAGATAVLLDNMAPDEVRSVVAVIRERSPSSPPLIEVSGGVSIENVRSYADTGADLVSTGSLTNSAPVLDIGLDMDDVIS